jgi:hypothetical protein
MYVCEKSLAPHDLCYLGLFNFAHSNFFLVIVIFKSSPKKCWNFIPFFGARIVGEPFIRKYLLSIHCHASNVNNYWKLLDCDNILSTLYTELACPNPHLGQSGRMQLPLPKVGDLESSGTLKNAEDDLKGQISSHWCVLYVIGKVLKCTCPKWPRMNHLDIYSPSYGQKKGRESNWQFDSRPLKV